MSLSKYVCQIPSADVIVLARVASIARNLHVATARRGNSTPGGVTVTLEILERFLGASSKPLVIQTETDTSACGYPFEKGREYLVFATKFQGQLRVSYCSATQPAKAAASRIRLLRAMRDGTALPSLFGSVLTEPLRQGEDRENFIQPGRGLTVVAQSGGQEYRTQTAHDGVYEFFGIPRGEYFVHVEAPAGRVVVWEGGVNRVRAPAGLEPRCPLDFQIFGDGSLSGTVVNRLGEPLSGSVTAEYVGADKPGSARIASNVNEGRFEFSRLWPGRYRLEFVGDGVVLDEPVYYPGTRSKSDSTLIELGEGTRIDNLRISVF